MVSVSGYLIGNQAANKAPLPPPAELSWWYQFYFATERGRAGYDKYRHDFAKLIWHTASPQWNFDDETFDRSAASFDNPDHVDIVIHNYRWRLGLAPGESQYDDLEQQLATGPVITVPTITLEGDANGAPHPDPSAYATKFSGKYTHRTISGGVGHNLPQEAPKSFVDAVLEVDGFVVEHDSLLDILAYRRYPVWDTTLLGEGPWPHRTARARRGCQNRGRQNSWAATFARATPRSAISDCITSRPGRGR